MVNLCNMPFPSRVMVDKIFQVHSASLLRKRLAFEGIALSIFSIIGIHV